MPSSPLDATNEAAQDPESVFRKGLVEMDQLIDQGVSLSGHERNCAFLNIPGDGNVRRFVTASATLGLDYDDDARAPAFVDWDRDGDLDLWTTNRTAPLVRYVRNDRSNEANWIALRLRGTSANRDGIGARVELELPKKRTLIRTLKAGEGYLGQSSKWLHFGLGKATTLGAIQVNWPGGKTETFSGASINQRFLLTEGKGIVHAVDAKPTVPKASPHFSQPPADPNVFALSASRWPLPQLPYTTFEGAPATVGGTSKGLTLVNLWATWCRPCHEELKSFAKQAPALSLAGIRVVALSVDGLSVEGGTGGPSDPARFYKNLQLPFEGGRALPELVRRLEAAYTGLWGVRYPLPVPTSVLLDETGALLAFYKGVVPIDRLLSDAGQRAEPREALQDAALPFPGRWFFRPQPLDPLRLGLDLMENSQVDAAYELAFRTPAIYRERSKEYAKFLIWIGDELMKQSGRTQDALKAYQAALTEDANNTLVLNNVAWQLAAHPDAAVRNGPQAVAYAEKAAELTKHQDPAILDTLAAAYAQNSQFKQAIEAAQRALKLAQAANNRALWEGIRKNLLLYQARKVYPTR